MHPFFSSVTGVVEPGQICAIMGARLGFILLITDKQLKRFLFFKWRWQNFFAQRSQLQKK